MQDVELIGMISEKMNRYILTTDDGTEYTVYAINPWESVPPEFDTAKFSKYVGEKVRVFGNASGTEIWNATMHSLDGKDTIPPGLEELDDLEGL
ncbi:MAG: hypothetical protein FK733_10490 [Asgard group archaeon]|nr:hypothetical protein [Asgard group archaeon]